jgi:cysteinyl-tRNA synthetase
MRKYVMDDILRRTLEAAGYQVHHVMNVTDVGHLTDDGDSGIDKLEKGAQKTGKTVWEVAEFYTDFFVQTMAALNVLIPEGEDLSRATRHIDEMITLIKKLEKNGFTYETSEAVYFNVTAFPSYGSLSGQRIEDKKQAVRKDVHVDPEKRHPADFSLWFKRTGRFADHAMHWPSPWGEGFPGWHIECSAMSMARLKTEEIDIHTGGIDHIPVHHENEIAQSEAATGHTPFVRHWVHHNFLMVENQKMSKSLGNFYTIEDVNQRGIHPLSLRLLFMQTHYRQEMNFTWESAQAAHDALTRLRDIYDTGRTEEAAHPEAVLGYVTQFKTALFDDLNTAQALAVLWNGMGDTSLDSGDKRVLLDQLDVVLGIGFAALPVRKQRLQIEFEKPAETYQSDTFPATIIQKVYERQAAKQKKDWARADELRSLITSTGFTLEDIPQGVIISTV